MTSRRPMTRSYSGNGRSGGSNNEEEISTSNGRLESCNYLSNVRPENRSTLFGVMAQLTEDTQPVFETTLKSKAVSENSNVKLTCVVTGNPAPDLKWYRDDMELDRYCGLPKYKIVRNGKTHTLYIYNCTVDDAAIYQASASNSKGIVSCSGVLEVGTMSEFKIHQRFFAKLKQKAENKRRELDESRRRGKDSIQKEPHEQQPLRCSPIPPLRKRHTQITPFSPLDGKENPFSRGVATAEQPATAVTEPNWVSAEVIELPAGSKTHNNDFDNMNIVTPKPPTPETVAKKKMKISNGVDSGVVSSSSSHTGSSSNENSYDGGISLAQFLSEALHSQTDEEKIAAQVDGTAAEETMDTTFAVSKTDAEKGIEEKWRERADRERMFGKEQEREKIIEKGISYEIEKERAREVDQLQRKTAHNASSDVKIEAKIHTYDHHDHHPIQETLSNVLHSVKDFFFGKSKKDNPSLDHHVKAQGKGHPITQSQPFVHQNPHPQELDSQLEVYQTTSDKIVSMEVDEPQKAQIAVIPQQQSLSLEQLNPTEHKHGITVSHSEKKHLAPQRALESGLDSPEHAERTALNVCLEVIKNNTERGPTSGPPALCEAAKDQFQTDPVPEVVVSVPHEPNIHVFSSRIDQVTKYDYNTEDFKEQSLSGSPWSPNPIFGEGLHVSNDTCIGDSGVSPTVSPGLVTVTTESESEKEMSEKETEMPEKEKELPEKEKEMPEKEKELPEKEKELPEKQKELPEKEKELIEKEKELPEKEKELPEKEQVMPKKGTGSVYETQEEKDNVKEENQPWPAFNVSAEIFAAVVERIETSDFKTQEQPTLTSDHNVNTQDSISLDKSVDALQENVETISSKVHVEYIPVLESREKINNKQSLEASSPTSPQENFKSTDVKIPEASSSMTAESTEDHDLNTKRAENSKESIESAFKVECIPPLKKDLVNCSFGTLTIQEQVTPHVLKQSVEQNVSLEKNEVLTHTIDRQVEIEETVNEIKVGESKIQQEPQFERDSALVSTVQPVISQEADDIYLGGYFGNIPKITVMDSALKIPDLKIILPEQQINEDEMIIPNIEITEPEVKDLKQPLLLIRPNEPKPEPVIFQNGVANKLSHTMITDNSASVIPVIIDVTPTQESMWNDNIIRPTEKVQEVTQSFEEAKTPIAEQPTVIKSECLTMKDTKLIPTINVSFTEDSQLRKIDNEHPHVKSTVLDTVKREEAPKLPLVVALPISAICENSLSESAELPKNENKDSESVRAMQWGVKSDFEYYITVEPDKSLSIQQKQNTETKEKSVTALLPKEVTTIIQKAEDTSVTETDKVKPLKESRIESYIIGDESRERTSIERLAVKPPTPPRSPSSLRRLMSRTPPAITVDDPANNEKAGSEQSGGDTPTSSLSCESSPRLKRRDSLTIIRSATPEELASGARRKIFIPREGEGVGVVVALGVGGSPLDTQVKKEAPYMSPNQSRRAAFLQAPAGSQTPPLERRSPLLGRKKATLEVPKVGDQANTEEPESPKTEVKPAEKEKLNPFKAPQVIRKIRGEPFPDASGHLKLWCQFFNVLSDSIIKWYKDEEEIVEVKRSAGDESQVALAIVQTSSQDCGVYGCTIKNEFGIDSTDFLLSVDILSEYFLREDLEVGEEIEMTPMLFTKGLADPGYWGDKLFGRIMTLEAHLGEGCVHKACRAKVIYGLDPVFESGSTCIIKVQNPIAYGTKEESNLAERNMEMTKQECKIQNTVREYCKIFSAEARVIENFGFSLEVNPLYLMCRPANSVPYATVEADLKGIFLKYSTMDAKGRLITRATSEVEMKCCSFQHWIYQWTNGNLLITGLEGVGPKITNIRIVTKSKGYQGLTEDGSPKVFEQFHTQHQCNYYCGLLSLRTLKSMDTLLQPPKTKGSRSPLLNKKLGSTSPQLNKKLGSTSPQLNKKLGSTSPQLNKKMGSTSPQLNKKLGLTSPQSQRKGQNSPLTGRKANSSPKVPRKTGESEENKSTAEPKAEESIEAVV